MPQVTVWKCCRTGTLFENKEEYVKHLKAMATKNLARKSHKKHLQAAINMVQSAKNIEALEIAASIAMTNYYKARGVSVSYTAITFERIYFDWKVSNSHSCPKNGVMNCGSKPNAPKGYPGLRGIINISFTETTYNNVAKARDNWDNPVLDFSDMLQRISINTGTGGYGGGGLMYDVKIFSDDFPNLAEVNNPIIEDILI